MDSDSDPSSSLKRSVADASPDDSPILLSQSKNTSSLSLSDAITDTAFSEHPVDDLSDSVSPHENHTSPLQNGRERVSFVEQCNKTPMNLGETWYLVSRHWYKRWRKACLGEVDKEGPLEDKDLGPVDNSSLVDKNGNLISTCIEGVDVEFVHQSIWSLFESWCVQNYSQSCTSLELSCRYGDPIHPLPRKVIARGIRQIPTLELHPPLLKALTLNMDPRVTEITGPPPPYVHLSSANTVAEARRALAQATRPSNILPETPYRVWRLPEFDLNGSCYPLVNLAGRAQVLHDSDKSVSEALIDTEDAFVVEFFQDGKWPSGVECPEPTRARTPPLFNGKDHFFATNDLNGSTPKALVNGSTAKLAGPSTPLKSAVSTLFGPLATHSKTSQEPGTLGLGNM